MSTVPLRKLYAETPSARVHISFLCISVLRPSEDQCVKDPNCQPLVPVVDGAGKRLRLKIGSCDPIALIQPLRLPYKSAQRLRTIKSFAPSPCLLRTVLLPRQVVNTFDDKDMFTKRSCEGSSVQERSGSGFNSVSLGFRLGPKTPLI